MQRPIKHLSLIIITACCSLFLTAQPQSNSAGGITITASGYHLEDADIDAGGNWSTSSLGIKLSKDWQSNGGDKLGLAFQYEHRDHSFSGDFAPWGSVQTAGVSGSWTSQLDDKWGLYVAPSIELSKEDGADSGDAIEYGAIVAFNRFYSRDLQIGYGAGFFTGLEDTTAFPLLLIRWQIDESWYVGNPFTPGPVGPAGLEIGYRSSENWTIAFGTAYRTHRFKLDDDGPMPNGYGETQAMALFVRSSHDFQNGSELHLYAGTLLAGELSLDDASGATITKTDFDPALLIAIAWQSRF